MFENENNILTASSGNSNDSSWFISYNFSIQDSISSYRRPGYLTWLFNLVAGSALYKKTMSWVQHAQKTNKTNCELCKHASEIWQSNLFNSQSSFINHRPHLIILILILFTYQHLVQISTPWMTRRGEFFSQPTKRIRPFWVIWAVAGEEWYEPWSVNVIVYE